MGSGTDLRSSEVSFCCSVELEAWEGGTAGTFSRSAPGDRVASSQRDRVQATEGLAFERLYHVPQQVSLIKKQPWVSTSQGPRVLKCSERSVPHPSPLQPSVNYKSCSSPPDTAQSTSASPHLTLCPAPSKPQFLPQPPPRLPGSGGPIRFLPCSL